MLTLQEKLALMMTSAGSQRALAAFLGVSHQKVGRWLKADYTNEAGYTVTERDFNGRRTGVQAIPAEYAQTINQAFQMHKEVSRQQAKVDKVPFDPYVPVFYVRPKARLDNKPSLRFIATGTHFMRPELRAMVITSVAATNTVAAFTVRSKINLYNYTKSKAETPAALDWAFKPQTLVDRNNRPTLRAAYWNRVEAGSKTPHIAPISTPLQQLDKWYKVKQSIQTTEKKLQERHSPNAITNQFANEIIFQSKDLTNAQKSKLQSRPKPKAKAKAKPRKR